MWYEDERKETEKNIIVNEMNKNENYGGSVFSFKGCEMDWKRWTCLNMRIINIAFVLVHLYLLKKDTKGERGEKRKWLMILIRIEFCFVFCVFVGM